MGFGRAIAVSGGSTFIFVGTGIETVSVNDAFELDTDGNFDQSFEVMRFMSG